MISQYIQKDHGLNLNPRSDLKTGNHHGADTRVMAMSDGEIDNENGIVFAAIWKYLSRDNSDYGLISSLAEICYNPETGYYSRWNPFKYSPQIHRNDMSLDNLIGVIYCSGRFAAKRINRKINFPFYIYDDIETSRLSRSLLLRPDVIYYIKNMAGDKSCWLFFPAFLVVRILSSIREKVTRPTIYQFITAHFLKLIGKKYSHVDTIWNRYEGWATSGKALTLIMLDSCYVPKWYKKLTYRTIGSIGALFQRYFTRTGKTLLKPLIRMAANYENN